MSDLVRDSLTPLNVMLVMLSIRLDIRDPTLLFIISQCITFSPMLTSNLINS